MKFFIKKIQILLKVYNIIIFLVQPYIWIRSIFFKKDFFSYKKRFFEKYGFYNKKIKPNSILIHAASVGEVLASIPLINILQKKYYKNHIIITTTTVSGYKLINLKYDKNIKHLYFPYDLNFSVNRFLNKVSPKIIIIIERELWPNFINLTYSKNIPLIIVSARLSNKSYIFYKKLDFFISPIFKKITLIATQNNEYKLYFLNLGLKKKQLIVTGNIKLNICIDKNLKVQSYEMKKKWNYKRKIFIAASTHKGEEIIIIQSYKKLLKIFPTLLLIIAPRNPNRFNLVKKLIIKNNLNYILRSWKKTPSLKTKVVIVDTIGELLLMYRISDIAFIGGSLFKNYYGHNPLEAIINNIPILVGPNTKNFSDIYNKLNKLNGLTIVKNSNDFIKNISKLLLNKKLYLNKLKNAYKIFNNKSLILSKLLDSIKKYIN